MCSFPYQYKQKQDNVILSTTSFIGNEMMYFERKISINFISVDKPLDLKRTHRVNVNRN